MSSINRKEYEESVYWPSLKKYPCKKLKGEHDFELAELSKPYPVYVVGNIEKYFNVAYYIYRCSACGKKHFTDKPLGVTKLTKDYIEK